MGTTAKGYPYPEAADLFDVPGDMLALATVIDANPGTASMTRAARVALAGAALWDGRVVFDTDWDQWFGWSAGRARWEFVADRITISTGSSAAIGATPTGLLNTTDIYTGLTVRNRNTADPTVTVEWVVVDTSPVTYVETSRNGIWLTWVPTVTGAVGAVDYARYKREGSKVTCVFRFVPSAAGSGQFSWSLPFTSVSLAGQEVNQPLGSGMLYDGSANQMRICHVAWKTTTTFGFDYMEVVGSVGAYAVASAGSPWVWTSGDQIRGTFTYEVA